MSGTSGPAHMFPDAEETTQYQIEIPSQDWDAWKATVPRSMTLYERIHALIVMDSEFDFDVVKSREQKQAEAADEIAEGLTPLEFSDLCLLTMKFQRIEQRAENALQWLDDGDMEKLQSEVEAIEDIASLLG